MAIADETSGEVHHEIGDAAVPSVFDLSDILQLVVHGLDERAFACDIVFRSLPRNALVASHANPSVEGSLISRDLADLDGISLRKPMPNLSFPSSRGIRETSSSGAIPLGFPMVYPVGAHVHQRNVVQSTSLSEMI